MSQRTTLPLHQIEPDPMQPRSDAAQDGVCSDLEASVKEVGVVQEILVEGPMPNGKYRIIFGERRYRAALKSGLTELPVNITDKVTELDRLELQLTENLHRRDLNIRDRARAFGRFVTFFPSQKEAADRLGISEGRLSQLLELNDLKPEVAHLSDSGIVRDASTLVMLNQYAKKAPEEANALISKAVSDGKVTRKDVVAALAPYRKTQTKKKPAPIAPASDQTQPPNASPSPASHSSTPQIVTDAAAANPSTPTPDPSSATQPMNQASFEGFEDVTQEKINKVRKSLKISNYTPSRVLIAQLVDAYLTLLQQKDAEMN